MDTVPFLLCELGAPLFTNLKGAGTYFMCIPAMNRRMYKTLVDITSAGVFLLPCIRKKLPVAGSAGAGKSTMKDNLKKRLHR